jgi:hypothetical protein
MKKKHLLFIGILFIAFSCKKADVNNPTIEENKIEPTTQTNKSLTGFPEGFETGTKTSY